MRQIKRSGTTTVEMGVVLPVFFIVLLGFIEVGRLFYAHNAAEVAALRGARRLALPSGTPQNAAQAAESYLRQMNFQRSSYSVRAIQVPTASGSEAVIVDVAIKAASSGRVVRASVTRAAE